MKKRSELIREWQETADEYYKLLNEWELAGKPEKSQRAILAVAKKANKLKAELKRTK